jgi:hypothetical protein
MANGSEVNPLQAARISVKRYLENNWKVLLAVVAIQAIAYSYLLTGITFTDHTLQLSKVFPYPSYITQAEGRWMQDILINLEGGSGNQSAQMSIAVLLQAVNGTLFAYWLNFKRQFHIFLVAALLCLFPPFLDYYGFPLGNINFVLGDTLCILGAYLLRRGTLRSALSSSLLYGLSLSIYQPKIALVFFTAIGSIILRATEEHPCNETIKNSHLPKELFLPTLSITVAVIIYWLSYKLSALNSNGNYVHINNLQEMVSELSRTYPKTIKYFSGDIGGLPLQLRFLPLIIIAAGASRAIAIVLDTKGKLASFMVGIAIFLSPAAINATWVINRESWPYVGRLYTAYAYFFLFFLSFLLRWRSFQKMTELAALVLLYLLFLLASQQANALELKTDYETSFINRIVQRVEPLIPDPSSTGNKVGLVVIGDMPTFDLGQYVRFPPRLGTSQALNARAFASYGHIDVINFFLGREGVRKPSSTEQKEVIDKSRIVLPWPNQQATFMSPSKAIGVVLEKYRPGGSVTWHDKQQRP